MGILQDQSSSSYLACLCLVLFIHFQFCCSQEQEQASNTFTLSSFKYPRAVLKPYQWRYIRVELPPWFSSMSLALESDVNLDLNNIKHASPLPIICIREGSFPLPDVHNASRSSLVMNHISDDSFVGMQNHSNSERCYPMQKNMSLTVSSEQISPGTWYLGFFNGIGSIRTQSKMINRGSSLAFSANVTVEGCLTSSMLGKSCNLTVNMLSCDSRHNLAGNPTRNVGINVVSCTNANGIVCQEDNEPKTYAVDVTGIVEELIISASNLTFGQTAQPSNTSTTTGLMSYARHDAMPLKTVNDFSGDISEAPLVIRSPKAGRWYITVQPFDKSSTRQGLGGNSSRVCYSLDLQVFQCPLDKAGLNCTWEKYSLQTAVSRNPSSPFESSYVPIIENAVPKTLAGSDNIFLEPLLSNYTREEDGAWTFFLLNVPPGATGGNIHFHLKSNVKKNYEIYVRYGGLPSLSTWDYFYANNSENSNSSNFFNLYDSSEDTINFYILYAKPGTWCFGLRQVNPVGPTSQTGISMSLERCPQKCSSRGTCQLSLDASGLQMYSFCNCDRDHGGFDCSIVLVTHRGHIRNSIFLIASNAAALLPAYWSLRNKAFAEWVLFTSSGVSSALYHACDVGTWCVLKFAVLQFLDFWLSFMAVVSTFVYLTTFSEGAKRTIHTVVAILTALMAETGPTRPSNITYVLGIGALGLLIGWLMELCTHYRSFSFSTELHLNLLASWEASKVWFRKVIKTIRKRFRWAFVVVGFAALALAATSWTLESTENYWIWHSMWHISIYTSSFFFLCSKTNVVQSCENERPSAVSYELTRQNSFSGGEQRQ